MRVRNALVVTACAMHSVPSQAVAGNTCLCGKRWSQTSWDPEPCQGLIKCCTSCLLYPDPPLSHGKNFYRVLLNSFIEFSYSCCLIWSILNMWTECLWCKINLEAWRFFRESGLAESNSSGCDKSNFRDCLAVLGMGMGFMGSLRHAWWYPGLQQVLGQTSGYLILWVVRTSSPCRMALL